MGLSLLVFSDIHSDLKTLERLVATEADYYFAAGDLVSWSKGLDKAGEILKSRAGRVYVIPGNHESARDIENLCEKYGLADLHGKQVTLGGATIAALGYSGPTPFNTPGEYSEEELARRLEPLATPKPDILICHAPPAKSTLDRAGQNQHFGSTAVRAFIERVQPNHFFCGHIHECEGVQETLGDTHCVNVGKRGYLLTI